MIPRGIRIASILAVGLLFGSVPARSDDGGKPRIEGLEARLEDGRARVSYAVADAWSEDARERVESGLRVRFVHRIEVVINRGLWLWPNKVVARTVVTAEAEYDSLTGRYRLLRRVESKIPKGDLGPEPIEERLDTDSVAEMERWMTRVDDVAVFDARGALPVDDPLRVRVESLLGRRYVWFVFPSTVDASSRVDLTDGGGT